MASKTLLNDVLVAEDVPPQEEQFNKFAWFGGVGIEQARILKQVHGEVVQHLVGDIHETLELAVNTPGIVDIALGAVEFQTLSDWKKTHVEAFGQMSVDDAESLTTSLHWASVSDHMVLFAFRASVRKRYGSI